MIRGLPPFLSELLDAQPRAGEGVHAWLFRVARHLHAHLPAVDIIHLLEQRVATCGRRVSRKEIEDAVSNSLKCAWQPSPGCQSTSKSPAKWPGVKTEQRAAIIRDGNGLADLWEASPVRIEDNVAHTEAIIDRLFPGNPLLCCGKSKRQFDTRTREEWRGKLGAFQHIVPSPMSAKTGLTKGGKTSAHSLNNTGARRFLIVEFDSGTNDEQAALLLHLATRAPMVLAMHSGGRSLHGWFYCAGRGEDVLRRFFSYSVSLGADPVMWTCFQFGRMPDGTRDNGKRQTIYFFNPNPITS